MLWSFAYALELIRPCFSVEYMKIILAPNAFKGSLTAAEAACAMEEGVLEVLPEASTVKVPVADGGDGLVQVALKSLHGERRKLLVTGPRFDLVEAEFCFVPEDFFVAIEMAQASGLALLPAGEQNPLETTTFGTGELILAALDLGVEKIAVGIGGSATNDGGVGMATALGIRFFDTRGKCVRPVGGSLLDIVHIDSSGLDERVRGVEIEAVCDVVNPLVGMEGAARVYGPQKGASPDQVEQLEAGLVHLAQVIKTDLGLEVGNLPGGGAAGGLGAGLYAFLGAALRPGVDVVLDLVGLDRQLQGADLILTGEGQINVQTVFGKAPIGVAGRARRQKIPCIAVAGSVTEPLGGVYEKGIDAVFSLCPGPLSIDEAMVQADVLLTRSTAQILRCFLAGRQ